MATKKTTTPTQQYIVTGRIQVDVMVDISSPSLEEAVAKSKTLKLEDFVDINGEVSNCEVPEIRSIWIND